MERHDMTTTPRTMDETVQQNLSAVSVRAWLRAEAAAAFVAGVVLYGWLGAPWLALLPLLLVPDLSMVGYLRSPRLGAITYNVVHNWVLGLGVLGLGLASGSVPVSVAGAILIAHVGMDRTLGYGLKLSSFQETHLGRIGREGKGQS
jgi:hypothetical protein